MSEGLVERAARFTIPDKMMGLLEAIRLQAKYSIPASANVLTIDPGETTGLCWKTGDQILLQQIKTKDIGQSAEWLLEGMKTLKIDWVRIEDYRVYDWKASDHSWAELHTTKLIGGIVTVCHFARLPWEARLAADAKVFWTDEKLVQFDSYEPTKGMRHARDAWRHMLAALSFGPREPYPVQS